MQLHLLAQDSSVEPSSPRPSASWPSQKMTPRYIFIAQHFMRYRILGMARHSYHHPAEAKIHSDNFRKAPTKVNQRFLQIIASVSTHNLVVWDAKSGEQLHVLEGHQMNTHILEGHPFWYNIVMSASYDGQTIVWDVEAGKKLKR